MLIVAYKPPGCKAGFWIFPPSFLRLQPLAEEHQVLGGEEAVPVQVPGPAGGAMGGAVLQQQSLGLAQVRLVYSPAVMPVARFPEVTSVPSGLRMCTASGAK